MKNSIIKSYRNQYKTKITHILKQNYFPSSNALKKPNIKQMRERMRLNDKRKTIENFTKTKKRVEKEQNLVPLFYGCCLKIVFRKRK